MAAPERFAETSDSSCIAGAVHTWHSASIRCGAEVWARLGGKAMRRREYAARPLTPCTAVCYHCHQSKAKGGLCHDTLGDTRHWIFGFLLISCGRSGAGPVRLRLDHALRRQEP